jgi:hypothetical protein
MGDLACDPPRTVTDFYYKNTIQLVKKKKTQQKLSGKLEQWNKSKSIKLP